MEISMYLFGEICTKEVKHFNKEQKLQKIISPIHELAKMTLFDTVYE